MDKKIQQDIESLKKEVEKIKERNKKVEADKAWEVSKTRTIFITLTTFLLLYIFMILVGVDHPFLNALISSVAYFLSTETYGIFKRWWLTRQAVKHS